MTDLDGVLDDTAPSALGRGVWIVAGAALALGAVESARTVATGGIAPLRAIAQNFPWWLLWAAMAPGIGALVARWRPERLGQVKVTLAHVGMGLLCAVAHILLAGLCFFPFVLNRERYPSWWVLTEDLFRGYFVLDLVTYAAIVGVMVAVESRQRERHQERLANHLALRGERLIRAVAEARLDALQRQVNPHFLFNTLNAIAGLARQHRHEGVVDMLAALGGLLRETLARDGQRLVTLREELEFTQRYIALQQVRFGAVARVHADVDAAALEEIRLPPFILQPLLENAFEHGTFSDHGDRAGMIEVTCTLRDGTVVFRITNPVSPRPRGEGEATGLGLQNVKSRLAIAYGGRARLTFGLSPAGLATTEVQIPRDITPDSKGIEPVTSAGRKA